jgi:hypothetical protein
MADKAFGPTNALNVDEILHQTGDEAVQVVLAADGSAGIAEGQRGKASGRIELLNRVLE